MSSIRIGLPCGDSCSRALPPAAPTTGRPTPLKRGTTDSLVRSSPLAELAVTKPGFQCQSLDSPQRKQVNLDGRPAKHHIDAEKVVAARMISTALG